MVKRHIVADKNILMIIDYNKLKRIDILDDAVKKEENA